MEVEKVWCLCLKEHSYESVIGGRTNRKIGYPYCSGSIVVEEIINFLLTW